jgi:hypothetical protein
MSSSPQASSFTRRHVLQGTAALAASSLLAGCGSSSSSSTASTPAVTNPQPVPNGTLTQANLSVAATSTGTIGPAFAGLSYEKDNLCEGTFSASNTNLIALFQRLGSSVLRIGGNSVDQEVWTPNGKGLTKGQIAPSDVASLAAFVKATGWKCLYGINLEGSAPASPYTTTPALAAADVAYAVQAFGSSLLGIEIGNECDVYGDGTNYYAGTGWSLSTFETLWQQYRGAILALTPNAHITGPADADHESTWTVPFGQYATKSEISLLTQHYYRGDGQAPTSTAAYLVTPDPALIADLQILQAGAQGVGLPYRISECNSFYNGGASGVSNSYASSLWVIDFLFNCAQAGASGVNFHGGGDGPGYTPIADSGGVVNDVRPEYYGIYLFTLASQGTLYQTAVSAGSLNVTAYAIKTAAGGLNLIVVNKDSTNNLAISAALPQTVNSASLIEMTQLTAGASAPSLTATAGLTIQGAAINLDGSFAPAASYSLVSGSATLTCYVPALSALLVQIV